MDEAKKKGFFSRNWMVILIIISIIMLFLLFTLFGGSSVSPDLRYFPT